jgi:hypothetical protein
MKEGGSSVVIDEDFTDDKSNVSALTNKSRSGKALDKHCLVCYKNISGKNWGIHVKKVHNGETTAFEKRSMMGQN